ncbi:hypothetical protein P5V15_008415 [Pogonomyrmex californicus]
MCINQAWKLPIAYYLLTIYKINVFLDPCHMLKLIWNVLGTIKELLDSTGNKIQWKYLEDLHQLQETEELLFSNIRSHDGYNNG